MKKFTLLASLLMFITMSYAVSVIPVEDALKASRNFLVECMGDKANQITLVLENTEYSADGIPATYRFKVGDKGFIIVSASELANPILAFSFESNFKTGTGADIYNEQYKNDISGLQKNPSSALKIRNTWNHYLAENFTPMITRGNPSVAPLITTRWTQEKFYNTMCPYNPRNTYDDDCHTPVGCVALTMANLLYYYRFPESGKGSVSYIPKEYSDEGDITYTYPLQYVNYGTSTYNYDAISNILTDYDGELAKLIYHCGVATRMGYGWDGSGTQSEYAVNAFVNQFGYPDNIQFVNIVDVVMHDSLMYLWENKAKDELNAHRPLFFSGRSASAGGHAWIVDGYTTIGNATYFHVNWGWDGNSNGFYLINNQNTMGSGTFNEAGSNSMMLNLMPNEEDIIKPAESFRRVTASFGTISDGAGNMKYAQNSNRRWVLACPDAKSYTLKFDRLNVKEGDKVIIYNGGTESSGIRQQYSGNYLPAACTDSTNIPGCMSGHYEGQALPAAITVNADSVLVVFTSTANSETDYGFVLSYNVNSFYSEGCSNMTYSSQTAVLTDKPDNEISDDPYRLSNVCEYTLNLKYTNRIVYAFNKFDIAAGDFVDIYYYKNLTTRELLAHYDINNAPNVGEVFSSDLPTFNLPGQNGPGARLIVRFASDNKDQGTGFELTYFGENTAISTLDDMKVDIYPNPAVSNLNVEISADEAQQITAKIVDFTGKTVYVDEISHNGGTQVYQIPVNNIAKGVYFIHLNTTNGNNIQKFIVK